MLMAIFMIVGLVGLVQAAPDNFGGNGNAWTNDYGMHYVNNNNPDLRFDWDNHRMATPGNGGQNADENAAVIPWGDGSLNFNKNK